MRPVPPSPDAPADAVSVAGTAAALPAAQGRPTPGGGGPGRAGLSPAHLSRLETGQRQPSLPMLLSLARVYGTTVSELLGETAADRDAVVRADAMEPTFAGGWTYWQAGGAEARDAGPAGPCAARLTG